MGGTSAYLSASQPVSPPGHLHPPAALAAPDQFRANSSLKPQQYSTPALGLMVALPGQLFYSTQIAVCLWFLAKNERLHSPLALAA